MLWGIAELLLKILFYFKKKIKYIKCLHQYHPRLEEFSSLDYFTWKQSEFELHSITISILQPCWANSRGPPCSCIELSSITMLSTLMSLYSFHLTTVSIYFYFTILVLQVGIFDRKLPKFCEAPEVARQSFVGKEEQLQVPCPKRINMLPFY